MCMSRTAVRDMSELSHAKMPQLTGVCQICLFFGLDKMIGTSSFQAALSGSMRTASASIVVTQKGLRFLWLYLFRR